MYGKAILFNDIEVANKILNTSDPSRIKKLGREVRGFTEAVWNMQRENVMFQGLYAKFTQNLDLRDKLLATGNLVIAECSPRDRIWGIGLSMSNPDRLDRNKWRGQNLLGYSLMRVRDFIREEMMH